MKFFKTKKNESNEKKHSIPAEEALTSRDKRIRILPLHEILFTLDDSSEKIELVNLSITGAGLLKESREEWPPVGSVLSGEFTYRKTRYPVEMHIKHINSNIIGCDFSETHRDSMRKLVTSYFDIELNALQLVKIDSQYIKQRYDGESSWFRGADNCEIFLVENENNIIYFNMSFFGNYIEGGEDKSISVSNVIDDDGEGKISTKKSDLVQQIDDSSSEILTHALKFVANANALTARQKSSLNNLLSKSLKQ